MNDNYNKIYDQLYDSYPDEFIALRLGTFQGTFFANQFIRELREFVSEQEYYVGKMRETILLYEMNNSFFLRPDAKMFLVTNFNQMIVKTLIVAKAEKQLDLSKKSLSKMINNDLETIMSYTFKIKKERKASGHDVMKAIDQLWGQLECTKLKIWG
ncbi:hypothetical protein [Polaribacter vadi]|uniref:hypothetical protein n=1 Tax=Polaribacter vadi TaxID=1774273 RepID=UPI0030EC942D|tara:strand:- start:26008 stop:26475 length:468 start_codon:yes stop_codon:yes gene_type:complete